MFGQPNILGVVWDDFGLLAGEVEVELDLDLSGLILLWAELGPVDGRDSSFKCLALFWWVCHVLALENDLLQYEQKNCTASGDFGLASAVSNRYYFK